MIYEDHPEIKLPTAGKKIQIIITWNDLLQKTPMFQLFLSIRATGIVIPVIPWYKFS